MPDPNDMVLIALAQKITEATQVITNFASANQLAFSLDSQSDPQDPAAISAPGSQAYHEARMAALEASSTLSALLSGTQTSFLDLCSHFHAASALRIVLKFNIAHAVPLQGSTSYGQVAQKSGLDTRTVQRILCFLMGYHIFRQPAPGRVAHSRLSQAMVSHEGLAALVQFSFGELYGYSYHMADALAKWGSSQEPNETGFNIAEDTTDGLYAFTDRQCGKARQSAFSTMMDLVASSELSSSDALFGALDWQGLGDAVVVDVQIAGSTGHVSQQLAHRYGNLQFIVQDFASVCARGAAQLPPELRDRIHFQAKDLFAEQERIPDRRAVYLLRTILHNWSDEYARRILRAIVPALKPEAGDRIVLNEQIMPEAGAGTASPTIERLIRFTDMTMLCNFNGQERTAEQFDALVRGVDPRLRIVQMRSPSALATGVIEIAWE